MFFPKRSHRRIGFIFAVLLPFVFVTLIQAQQPQTTTIQLVGVIDEINGTIIDISGVQVDVSTSNMSVAELQVGMTVSVSGTVVDGVVSATTIVIIALPTETATPDPEVTEETPTEPQPTATTAPISDVPLVVIEGPVQEINVNFITIFDIDIQVDSGDPVLTQIRLGDVIRIEGATEIEGDTIIIVAVNITIIQVQAVVIISPGSPIAGGLPANCRMTPRGRVTCRSRRTNR